MPLELPAVTLPPGSVVNAGFSTADKTWLPVPPSAAKVNVAAESKDPNSILNFYKRLIALRRNNPAFRDGSYISVNRDDPDVLSFLRKNPAAGNSVLVVLNMSASPHTLSFDLSSEGIKEKTARLVLAAPELSSAGPISLDSVTLPPFGVLLADVR